MRILFGHNSMFLPRDRSGANVSLDALCRRLAARGIEPIVLCGLEPGTAPAETPPSDARPYRLVRAPRPAHARAVAIARFAPAATVLRGPAAAADVAGLAASAHRLHVYFESSFLHRCYPTPRNAPHLRYAACSPFLARMAESYFAAPVAMIPPLVEPEPYRVARPGDSVLFVNPVAIKGVHIAAAVAARLPHRRFLFARSWPDTEAHPHVAVDLPNVEWLPVMDDMRAAYARARLVLVPSVWEEGAGRVVVEAQVSGIPAVASDRGGLPDSVGPGGAIVPLAAPVAAWCEAVETLFADRHRYAALSDAAQRHAKRPDYLPDGVVDRFLAWIGA